MAKNWNHFSYPPTLLTEQQKIALDVLEREIRGMVNGLQTLRAMVNLPQHFEEMGNLIERIKM
jgi:hypothetical protein